MSEQESTRGYELLDSFELPYDDESCEHTGFAFLWGRDPDFEYQPRMSLIFERDGEVIEGYWFFPEGLGDLVEWLVNVVKDSETSGTGGEASG